MRKSVEVGVYRRGWVRWVTLRTNFRQKLTNHCQSRITRVIALLCAIKISTVRCLMLSQSMRVTDGLNYDSHDHTSIAASCSKMSVIFLVEE